MEIRSHRRIRDLVAHTAFQGLDANEIGCVRISMMAGSNTLRSKGRIQMSETSHLQISHIRLATHGRSIQMCQIGLRAPQLCAEVSTNAAMSGRTN